MLKEFVDQIKPYKELAAIVVALVTGALFIANYFATKDALEDARKKLDALITQRECELSNRITIAESSARISTLEKQKLEKSLDRKELVISTIPKAPRHIQLILTQRVSELGETMSMLDRDISAERTITAEAKRAYEKHECSGKQENKGK